MTLFSSTKPYFIPYLMAGANGMERLEAEIRLLEKHGASAIELGIPFSDPVADGPVIEQAGICARKKGVTLASILTFLQEHDFNLPIILMGYANSFFHYGLPELVKQLESTNVKALIIPDLPYEHRELVTTFLPETIALIPMVSLTSSATRITQLTKQAQGFIYAVTVNGITGNHQRTYDLAPYFDTIKNLTPLPICAGFGIATAEDVAYFLSLCDGMVIGSAIVDHFSRHTLEETDQFLTELLAPFHQSRLSSLRPS